ncbi:MAG: DUF4129 domain-containing protein [Chloroflexi bacterium]|nr:DUF4129 domain-containing protein [Chloroflexota bacterium]
MACETVALAQSEAISWKEFHAIIREGVTELEAASARHQETKIQEQVIRKLRDRLSQIEGVVLENGEIIQPDLSFLNPDAPEATLSRLRLLDAQLSLANNDDTEARMLQLEWVMQEMSDENDGWMKGLPKLTSQPSPLSPDEFSILVNILQWAVILLGGALLVFIFGNWFAGLLNSFVEDVELHRNRKEDAPLTKERARAEATRLASVGKYRDAVRYLYLAALLKLEESGVTPRDRSQTNRELLALIPENEPIHQHFQSVVEIFERAWYGMWEPDMAAFRQYEKKIDLLDRTLSGRRAASGPSAAEG